MFSGRLTKKQKAMKNETKKKIFSKEEIKFKPAYHNSDSDYGESSWVVDGYLICPYCHKTIEHSNYGYHEYDSKKEIFKLRCYECKNDITIYRESPEELENKIKELENKRKELENKINKLNIISEKK